MFIFYMGHYYIYCTATIVDYFVIPCGGRYYKCLSKVKRGRISICSYGYAFAFDQHAYMALIIGVYLNASCKFIPVHTVKMFFMRGKIYFSATLEYFFRYWVRYQFLVT